MILGTVGTHTAAFDRLVRALDDYAAGTDEEVLIQIGSGSYEPRHASWFRMTTSEHMAALLARARVVVTHGGDSVLEALRLGKPVIVVPRQRRFGEHIDDHQVDLARALAAMDYVTGVEDVADLAERLAGVPDTTPARHGGAALVTAIRTAIGELA